MTNVFKHDTFGNLFNLLGTKLGTVTTLIILWNEKIEISLSQDSTMCYLKLKDSNLLYPLYFSKREK